MNEQIILCKNINLAHFKIVQNFHYFCKGSPVEFWSKIQISKNCLKLSRITSFNEWNKFSPKNIFLAHFKIVQNFNYFCKARAFPILVKNSNFQKLPKIVEKYFF